MHGYTNNGSMADTMLEAIAVLKKHGLSLSYYSCLDQDILVKDRQRRLRVFHRVHSLHTASQMYLLNLHPPEKHYNKHNDPSVNEIDVLVRLEHMEDGIGELREMYPELMKYFNKEVIARNENEGHFSGEEKEEEMPCSVAWAIYDYFVQDFVCLGYELPEECMKEECRPKEESVEES